MVPGATHNTTLSRGISTLSSVIGTIVRSAASPVGRGSPSPTSLARNSERDPSAATRHWPENVRPSSVVTTTYRVRTGNPIGVKVTLRGERMWDFLERLTRLALPRIRDFRGVPGKSFDGRGNYSLGLREQLAFPEIDYDKVDRLRGLEISIVTTAKTDEESKRLLELLGMPFAG